MATSRKINRREFVGSAAAASIGFTIVPGNVLGGAGFTPPSDKLTIGYIGCGTQGLREMTPDELLADGKTLSAEGMMFVGDKGKIVAGFRGEDPKLIPEFRMKDIKTDLPEESYPDTTEAWITAFRDKKQSPGSFTLAVPVTETILLGAVALRAWKRVEYDTLNVKITNVPEANKFLTREYRKGWEL